MGDAASGAARDQTAGAHGAGGSLCPCSGHPEVSDGSLMRVCPQRSEKRAPASVPPGDAMEVLQQVDQLGAGGVFAGPERAPGADLHHCSPLTVSGPCRNRGHGERGQPHRT